MCTEQFDVEGLSDERTAYEVEQYLRGLPHVEDVQADFLDDTLVVQYDEDAIDHTTILDEIEHAGCVPTERINGIVGHLKHRLSKTGT